MKYSLGNESTSSQEWKAWKIKAQTYLQIFWSENYCAIFGIERSFVTVFFNLIPAKGLSFLKYSKQNMKDNMKNKCLGKQVMQKRGQNWVITRAPFCRLLTEKGTCRGKTCEETGKTWIMKKKYQIRILINSQRSYVSKKGSNQVLFKENLCNWKEIVA